MHMDPSMPALAAGAICLLILGVVLRKLKQPYVLGYLIGGVLMGRHGLGLLDDAEALNRIGAIGVILLLFFAGLEVSLPRLVASWRIAVLGTLFQIGVSVASSWGLGQWLGWPLSRSVLLGFVISLSSTAVVLKILADWGELETPVGQNVLGILLVQDIAVVPMIITLSFLAGQPPSGTELALQGLGALLLAGVLGYVAVKKKIRAPLAAIRSDPELQVFGALGLCFGFALITGLLHLSAALGAFVAGIVVAAADESHWVHDRLEPFRVVFVATFFVSVGMALDVDFVIDKAPSVAGLVALALITNTFLNAGVLRWLGTPWPRAWYAAAFLAPIGEFSFVMAAIGLESEIIETPAYQTVIAVIFLTMLVSPFWIQLFKRVSGEAR